MDPKRFVLSYYKNSIENFHIQRKKESSEAEKLHSHEYFQIYFIIKGGITHYVGEQSSVLNRGDMFIIPPDTAHRVSFKSGTVFYSISFGADFLNPAMSDNRLARNFLSTLSLNKNQGVKPKISISSDEILYIEGMMEHILKEFTEKPLGYYSVIQTYTELFITILARSYFESAKPNFYEHFETDRQLVLHSIEYIKDNYAEALSLGEIIRKTGMSKNKFCRLFMSITGHSFKQYVNICRIKKATEYIRQGYKVSALYGLCGYYDFSTFYRNFKKIMGVSPSKYIP